MTAAIEINDGLLEQWPLPKPEDDGDKEGRGCVLVVAGSIEMPGAAILSATAALRAGAGKLTVATASNVAPGVGLAVPEALVLGLACTDEGKLSTSKKFAGALNAADAVLIGPGWTHSNDSFVRFVLENVGPKTQLVLDAAAMDIVKGSRLSRPALLTPHAGEMASLLNVEKAAVKEQPQECVLRAARQWNCVVALKGATTFVATCDGQLWRHCSESPGLGTSGSGDALAGLVIGLVARGATLERAAAWGVAIHARAGQTLADKCGPLGFLARELSTEFPALLARDDRPA